jgi:hypothetical protein
VIILNSRGLVNESVGQSKKGFDQSSHCEWRVANQPVAHPSDEVPLAKAGDNRDVGEANE